MNVDQIRDYFEDFTLGEPYEYTHWKTGITERGVHTYRGWPGVIELLENGKPREFEGLGSVETIESVGGEGEGDHMHLILRITFPDGTEKLYKKNGRWVSYNGAYWEYGDFFEVQPVQEVVTKYKKVK
ncbi:hypothetical protein [Nocardia jiangxiensis]|uniref:hypothetical protein n=1 Tax=Nocardia jiangxiensis TaxID=282685 RepID=UPI0002F033CF|nr:hypothetical protein [Nocardia jiangxiensis]